MGNGTSTDRGSYTTHGSRDVGKSAVQEQHYWSPELVEASNIKNPKLLFSPDGNPHITTDIILPPSCTTILLCTSLSLPLSGLLLSHIRQLYDGGMSATASSSLSHLMDFDAQDETNVLKV